MRCSLEAYGGRSCSGRWPAVRSCGGDGSVVVGRGVAEGLRAPGLRGSVREAPAEVIRRLGSPRPAGDEEIEAAAQLTGGGSLAKYRCCRGSGHNCWAWEASRRCGGADAGLIGVGGAAERPNHGKAEEASAADERGRRR
jgi:hypothetical protein